jgi:maltose O-acetyltransferase
MRKAYEECRRVEARIRYDLHPTFGLGDESQLYGDGEIHGGENSYIGWHTAIQAEKGQEVTIGKNTAISHFCRIYTSNRDPDQDLSKGKRLKVGNVTIGDHCWIGANVTILEGVQIGSGTVVGANSLVDRDLPAGVIAGGSPLRIIREKVIE